jgi:hypothetical protein
MRENTSLTVFGTQGNSQAQNSVVATLAVPAPGRYKIWGMGRHTLADGLKITSPISLILCSGPNDTAAWGPILVDVFAANLNITIQLNVATGASDTAAANIYAELMNH